MKTKKFSDLGDMLNPKEKEEEAAPNSKSKDDLIVEAILNTLSNRESGLENVAVGIDEVTEDEEFKVGSSMTLPTTLKNSVEILVEIGDSSLTIVTRKANKGLKTVAKWLRKLEENSNE